MQMGNLRPNAPAPSKKDLHSGISPIIERAQQLAGQVSLGKETFTESIEPMKSKLGHHHSHNNNDENPRPFRADDSSTTRQQKIAGAANGRLSGNGSFLSHSNLFPQPDAAVINSGASSPLKDHDAPKSDEILESENQATPL